MSGKIFIWLLTTVLLSSALPSEAQQAKKVRRIAVLSASYTSSSSSNVRAFRQALRELGYIEGKDIDIEHRNAEGKPERLNELVAEMVRDKVDVIVTVDSQGTEVSAKATRTIPIVMTQIGDAVGAGIVASLAKPGGNVTGLTQMQPEISGKRLDLLRETFPKVSRVTVLYDPTSRSNLLGLKEIQTAAPSFGVIVQPREIRGREDIDRAFSAMARDRGDALMTIRNPLVGGIYLNRIVELAAKSRLPAMYDGKDFVEVGGLMSYAANFAEMWRRAATYVDKLLKGAKAADLPVEQPTKFEFVINLKTAEQISLTIPPNVLARADRVIR
jgi:putative tryptophan/tyrosine transport system substrate-binding protein